MQELDIHEGLPTVKEALDLLKDGISYYKKQKLKALKVVVGYGSTGGTHRIKTKSIEYLNNAKNKKEIKDFIVCSDLGLANQKYLNLKEEYQKLIPKEERKILNDGAIIIFF